MKKTIVALVTTGLLGGAVSGAIPYGVGTQAFAQGSSCSNLLTNGTMEADSGWNLSAGPIASRFATSTRDDSRALLVGPAGEQAAKGQRWSSAQQLVTLPAAGPLSLSFWYDYTTSDKNDRMQVALLDEKGDLLKMLIDGSEFTKEWTEFSADLGAYAGQKVQVFFAVESDGATGRSKLLVDDVTLCGPASVVQAPTQAPAAAPTAAPAAAPAAAPTVASNESNDELLTLGALGLTEQTLRSPYDTSRLAFGLPAHWKVGQGAELRLRMGTFRSGETATGSLDVLLNGKLLGTIPVDQTGETERTLAIPADALVLPAEQDRHELQFTLNSADECAADQQVRVVVRATSALNLPHTEVAPSTNLRELPRILTPHTFLPDVATVVVPDAPSAATMQAALVVAAGLGHLSDGKLALSLTPIGKLSKETRASANLVFVGTAAGLPLLKEAKLPAPVGDAGYTAAEAQPGDGIVQLAASPWNPAGVLLVVGGNDDAALLKAGQAVAYGTLRTGASPDLAVVAAVQQVVPGNATAIDRSFADLGYAATTLTGRGEHIVNYRFDVPAGQIASGESYLDLVFNHSALLDYNRSLVELTLNNQPVKSLRLSDESTQLKTLRVDLPRSAVQAGSNELTIKTLFSAGSRCGLAEQNDLWMMIWPETALHLPMDGATTQNDSTPDLGSYPYPFALDTTLSNTAFVLAPNDPVGWDVAAGIAAQLGADSSGTANDLRVFFGNEDMAQARQVENLIVVGRPSNQPLVAELRGVLPASFAEGKDLADERGMRVVYRVAEGSSVGYLQFVQAPWNANTNVLTVLGSTDEGLREAGAVLTTPTLRARLGGNLAVVNGGQITTDAAGAVAQAPVGGAVNATTAQETTEASQATVVQRDWWLLPGIVVSLLGIIGILAYVVRSALGLPLRLWPK